MRITGAKDGHALRFKGAYRPCESGAEPIECDSAKKGLAKKAWPKRLGEKRNDHPARRQCRARMRAAAAGCCGPWARRHTTGCATSRAQRGDEQVLPMPHRCDVSRSATGSTRMGGRDLSHDRTRRVVDARRDQFDG